jgi:glycine cleavage system regulatory protein
MSAELLFHARVEAALPKQGNLEELSDSLDAIANEMDVDIQVDSG